MSYLPKPKLYLTLTFLLILFSCKKQDVDAPQDVHYLGVNNDERVAKINQSMTFYDSTDINDSIEFVHPPKDKYYRWSVTPNNGCATITTTHDGFAKVNFKCSGIYEVSATIYDSLNQKLVGKTSSVAINVTTDTLHPSQAIYADDVLNIQAGLAKSWTDPHTPGNSPPDDVWIYLNCSTTKLYNYFSPYTRFNFTSQIAHTNYTYTFTDSIQLTTYPFVYAYGTTSKVFGWIDMKGLAIGIPATLKITWLGKIYSGTITLTNDSQYTLNWDNSGAVKIQALR
jgi:hypothetical protein